jgi:hypothetical protein
LPEVQLPAAPSMVHLLYPVSFTSNTLCVPSWYRKAARSNNKFRTQKACAE